MKAYAIQQNRPDAERNALIASHVEVARRISLRIARRCPDWIAREDLVAAGLLGLTEAAMRYDTSRGEPFHPFAEKRIRGAVLDELRRGDIMPRRARQMARKIGQTIQEIEKLTGSAPSDEEVAARSASRSTSIEPTSSTSCTSRSVRSMTAKTTPRWAATLPRPSRRQRAAKR